MNIKQDFNGHITADFDPKDLAKVVAVVQTMEAGRIQAQQAADAETLQKMAGAQDIITAS